MSDDFSHGVGVQVQECNMEYDTMLSETLGGRTHRINTGQRMILSCEVIGEDAVKMHAMLHATIPLADGARGSFQPLFNSQFVIIRSEDLVRLLPEYVPPEPPQRPRLRPARRQIELGDE